MADNRVHVFFQDLMYWRNALHASKNIGGASTDSEITKRVVSTPPQSPVEDVHHKAISLFTGMLRSFHHYHYQASSQARFPLRQRLWRCRHGSQMVES